MTPTAKKGSRQVATSARPWPMSARVPNGAKSEHRHEQKSQKKYLKLWLWDYQLYQLYIYVYIAQIKKQNHHEQIKKKQHRTKSQNHNGTLDRLCKPFLAVFLIRKASANRGLAELSLWEGARCSPSAVARRFFFGEMIWSWSKPVKTYTNSTLSHSWYSWMLDGIAQSYSNDRNA